MNTGITNESVSQASTMANTSPQLVELIVAIEDKRYWSHTGFDPKAIMRALLRGAKACRFSEGGSTIPEQLLKMGIASRRRTLWERASRAVRAIALVRARSKPELLAEYLSKIYLGRSYYGVSAGARGYFGCAPTSLSPAQAFFLAERIALPNRFRPARVENILRRQDVLGLLGQDVSKLPAIYRQVFGSTAGEAMSRILGEQHES